MSTGFKPGEAVPKSGIYKVTHATDHESAPTVTLLGGNIFPRCRVCTYPRFELIQAAISAEVYDQFKPTTEKHKELRRLKRVIIFAVLFFFLVGGFFLIWSAHDLANVSSIASAAKLLLHGNKAYPTQEAPEHELLIHFFNEMGIAFVVAAILGATFEFFMRRREERELNEHIRQIEEAALLSLLGYFMPRALSDQVRRVFKEQIMRSNLELTYTFQKPGTDLQRLSSEAGIDGNDLLLVTVKVEYDLINLATTKTKHLIHHGFESILPFGEYDTFLSLIISRGDDVWISWPNGPNKEKVCKCPGPHACIRVLKLKSKVSIAPGKEVADEPKKENTYHVAVEHQVVRRRRDLDSWTTWLPADSLDVNVLFEAVPDLDFHLDRTHPDDFLKMKVKQPERERRWTLPSYPIPIGRDGKPQEVSAAVLPYQGFTLYWFPWFPRDIINGAVAAADKAEPK